MQINATRWARVTVPFNKLLTFTQGPTKNSFETTEHCIATWGSLCSIHFTKIQYKFVHSFLYPPPPPTPPPFLATVTWTLNRSGECDRKQKVTVARYRRIIFLLFFFLHFETLWDNENELLPKSKKICKAFLVLTLFLNSILKNKFVFGSFYICP